MPTRLSKLVFKKESNYNIIKSYDLSRDRSNLIEIILYVLRLIFLLIICHLTYLNFLVNFCNQPFKSTSIINLVN